MKSEQHQDKGNTGRVALLVMIALSICQLVFLLRRKSNPSSVVIRPVSSNSQVQFPKKQPRLSIIERSSVFGNLAAVVAASAAIIALYINIQEVQQMKAEVVELRQYNRLSAIPRLVFERILVPTSRYPTRGLYLTNYGPGLAILETYKVYVDGEEVIERWKSATQMLRLDDLPGFRFSTPVSSLPPGQEFNMMWVEFASQNFTVQHRDKFAEALSRLRIEIKYSSIYGEEFTKILEEYD